MWQMVAGQKLQQKLQLTEMPAQYRAGVCFLVSPPAANILADPDHLSGH